MRSVLMLIILLAMILACAGYSSATEIDGKWGLGVRVGDFVSSQAEGSIIRGISRRSAWILDIAILQNETGRDRVAEYFRPDSLAPLDTTITDNFKGEAFAFNAGPRYRRFMLPESSFSPYGDLYAHFVKMSSRSSNRFTGASDTRIGGTGGFAIGAEFFSTRWPVSLAAHTEVVSVAWAHNKHEDHYSDPFGARASNSVVGNDLTVQVRLNPVLQIRVYF